MIHDLVLCAALYGLACVCVLAFAVYMIKRKWFKDL